MKYLTDYISGALVSSDRWRSVVLTFMSVGHCVLLCSVLFQEINHMKIWNCFVFFVVLVFYYKLLFYFVFDYINIHYNKVINNYKYNVH